MSPASYRTAPPRVGEANVTGVLGLVQIEGGLHHCSAAWSSFWAVAEHARTFGTRGRAGEAGLSMLGRSGRETRTAAKAAALVRIGLCTQRWRVLHRPRAAAEVQQLHISLDRERRRADGLAEELAAARALFDRTLSRINDVFWTVEVLPEGSLTLTYLSSDASGVVGGD